MKCLKCENEMKQVKMSGNMTGMPVYLSFKKKGIMETEKTSTVDCYVCTKCGYVELKAVNPEVFTDC